MIKNDVDVRKWFGKFEEMVEGLAESLKFELRLPKFNGNSHELYFLDLTLKLDNGMLSSRVFTKKHQVTKYLNSDSVHRQPTKKNISAS